MIRIFAASGCRSTALHCSLGGLHRFPKHKGLETDHGEIFGIFGMCHRAFSSVQNAFKMGCEEIYSFAISSDGMSIIGPATGEVTLSESLFFKP